MWGSATDDFINTTKGFPQYPRVVSVLENPLYNFILSKAEKCKTRCTNRHEQGLLDAIETQHFNIIWLIKRYYEPTPLLRQAIASPILMCINKMLASLTFTYMGWNYHECNEYDYKVLTALKDCTITCYMTSILNINRYDTEGFNAISPPQSV